MIQPKLEDYEIEYYFVKEFKWLAPELTYKFNGFPEQGSVQRVIYNKAAKTRGLVLPTKNNNIDNYHLGHFSNEEDIAYSANLIEITKKSILELNLSEEHLTQLTQWLEGKNEDLYKYLRPEFEVPDKIMEATPENITEIGNTMLALHDLQQINYGHFAIVVELVHRLLEDDNSYDPAHFVRISTNGSGLNIGEAIRDLNQYLSGPKYGDDRDQLFSAITNIFSEIDRRDNLQLD